MQCRDESATDMDNFLYWGDDAVPIKGARNKDDHYLQLDQNETDLIRLAEQHFDNIIVVLNTSSHFECVFLDDPGHYAYSPKIRSAIWIGDLKRVDPIAGIISGRINPSGHLPDTYARDFKADPTWQNFGNQRVKEGNVYSNLTANNRYRKHYVYYKEGIYYGYYYYETRGVTEGDGKWTASGEAGDLAINGTTTEEWNNWYDAHVVYPFGHGLSYASFVYRNFTAEAEEDGVSILLDVCNTSDRAGKEVVEVYVRECSPVVYRPDRELKSFDKVSVEGGGSRQVAFRLGRRAFAHWSAAEDGWRVSDGVYEILIGASSEDIRLIRKVRVKDGNFSLMPL